MAGLFNSQEREDMLNDIEISGLSQRLRYDIRRQVRVTDTTLGGVTVTSTAIETIEMEIQELNGRDVLALGGLRIEAQYRGFCPETANIQEQDILTHNSGAISYQVVFVKDTFLDHVEFFAKRMN